MVYLTDKYPRPKYSDGTPAHTYSVNHVMQVFDLNNGDFPLISLRNIAVKSAIGEILWIYKDQSTYLKKLAEYGVTWWDEWDIGDGTIGQCYGKTVKDHQIIDNLIKNLNDFKLDDFKIRDYPRDIINIQNPKLKLDIGI